MHTGKSSGDTRGVLITFAKISHRVRIEFFIFAKRPQANRHCSVMRLLLRAAKRAQGQQPPAESSYHATHTVTHDPKRNTRAIARASRSAVACGLLVRGTCRILILLRVYCECSTFVVPRVPICASFPSLPDRASCGPSSRLRRGSRVRTDLLAEIHRAAPGSSRRTRYR